MERLNFNMPPERKNKKKKSHREFSLLSLRGMQKDCRHHLQNQENHLERQLDNLKRIEVKLSELRKRLNEN